MTPKSETELVMQVDPKGTISNQPSDFYRMTPFKELVIYSSGRGCSIKESRSYKLQ